MRKVKAVRSKKNPPRPRAGKPKGTGARLSDAVRASIVRLRRADPERWTFAALAHRFGGTDSNAYAVVRAGARAGAVAASGRAGHATLLALFGTAMSVSFGVKSPLDYSVFSASAGALLLALHERAPA